MTTFTTSKRPPILLIAMLFLSTSLFGQSTDNVEFYVYSSDVLSTNITDWVDNNSLFFTVLNNTNQEVNAKPFIRVEDFLHKEVGVLIDTSKIGYATLGIGESNINPYQFITSSSMLFKGFQNGKKYYLEIAVVPEDNSVTYDTRHYSLSVSNNKITLENDKREVKKNVIDIKELVVTRTPINVTKTEMEEYIVPELVVINSESNNLSSSPKEAFLNPSSFNRPNTPHEPIEEIESKQLVAEATPLQNQSVEVASEITSKVNQDKPEIVSNASKAMEMDILLESLTAEIDRIVEAKVDAYLNSLSLTNSSEENFIASVPKENNQSENNLEIKTENASAAVVNEKVSNVSIDKEESTQELLAFESEPTSLNEVFAIEFLVLRNKIDLDLVYYDHLVGYEVFYMEDGMYHYRLGNFETKEEVLSTYSCMKHEHKSLSIIKITNLEESLMAQKK